MRKQVFFSIVLSLFFGSVLCPVYGQNPDVIVNDGLRIVTLEGTPHERGVQHGKALKKEIHELIRQWMADIHRTYNVEPPIFISKFVSDTNYKDAIKKYTPNLWEELEGMAEGAGVHIDMMYAFQLVDEFWCLGHEVAASLQRPGMDQRGAPPRRPGPDQRLPGRDRCTTFGAGKSGDQPSLAAQTLDIPMYHGYQTLLHVKDPETKLESYVLSFPGLVGANGMNNCPVSICVNAVQQLDATRDGLPVAFVVRGVLEKKNYDEAVAFLKEITFGAPQNYLIGGADKVTAFECAGDQVVQYIPFAGARFTYHTNHPLVNRNLSPGFLKYLESKDKTPDTFKFSCPRFSWLNKNYSDNDVTIDVDELKKIFSHRESNINNKSTFSCTIMVLSGKPELHITAGRPDEAVFNVFKFD